MVRPVQIFLQTDPRVKDPSRTFLSDIAVVPGLKNDARDLVFILWIAQNETVLPTVFHQPLLGEGVHLALVQIHVFRGIDIRGESQLMLAGPRDRDRSGREGLGLLPGAHGIDPPLDLLIKEHDLLVVGPVARAYDGRPPGFLAVAEHFHQGFVGGGPDHLAVGQFDRFHLVILGKLVPLVDEDQKRVFFQFPPSLLSHLLPEPRLCPGFRRKLISPAGLQDLQVAAADRFLSLLLEGKNSLPGP